MDSETDKKQGQGAGPKGQRVKNPIEQRSPNNQSSGWKDFDDYPGAGPLPIENAPVHPMQDPGAGVQIGVDFDENPVGANPGDVPNSAQSGADLDPDAMGSITKPDDILDKRSQK